MAELGYITAGRGRRGRSRRQLRLKRGTRYTKIREPYFFDYVKQQLIDKYGINTVRTRWPEDPHDDRPAVPAERRARGDQLHADHARRDPVGAIVATDPRTGYVTAMASSGGYGQSQFNLAAQGSRQPGSAFKTMVLMTAIRQGIDPTARPTTRTRSTSRARRTARSRSRPTRTPTAARSTSCARPSAPTTRSTSSSTSTSAPTTSSRRRAMMGIRSKLNGYPAEGLGGLERGVSPLEMSRAYATLAAGGVRSKQLVITKVDFPGDDKDDAVTRSSASASSPTASPTRSTKILAAERDRRNRHRRAQRRLHLPGRRQDRHDRQLPRRLVRRLHADARDRRLGRLSRTPSAR